MASVAQISSIINVVRLSSCILLLLFTNVGNMHTALTDGPIQNCIELYMGFFSCLTFFSMPNGSMHNPTQSNLHFHLFINLLCPVEALLLTDMNSSFKPMYTCTPNTHTRTLRRKKLNQMKFAYSFIKYNQDECLTKCHSRRPRQSTDPIMKINGIHFRVLFEKW